MEQHFATPEPLELYVENGEGTVDVTAADVTESVVEVTGDRADEVAVDLAGRRLSVIAPKHGLSLRRSGRLTMRIVVPTASSVSARLGSSDFDAHGELATAEVKSGSGDLTLETVTQASILQTGSGDVALTTTRAAVRVKTGSGDLRVGEARADVEVTTGSGDVRVDTLHADAGVKSGSGDVRVGESRGDVSFATGSGDLTVDRASRGRISVKGASGTVKVGVVSGTPVWTDISTVTGSVRSTLPSVGEPEPGADHVEVHARTVSGDVSLVEA